MAGLNFQAGSRLRVWLRGDDAQAAAEYGLVGAIIAIGAIGILSAIGTDFNTFFTDVVNMIVTTVNKIL